MCAIANRQSFLDEKFGNVVIVPYSRSGFYQLLEEMAVKIGCEVGVAKGKNAEELLLAVPSMERLYLVDSYAARNGGPVPNKHYKMMKQRLQGNKKRTKFIVKSSMEAVKDFNDECLDFVYIDASHSFEAVSEDIREWVKKVKQGGIVGGHDYCRYKDYGVIEAVKDYVESNGIKTLWLTKEHPCSYFFVKP